MMHVTRYSLTVAAQSGLLGPLSVHLSSGNRQAGLAAGPGRIPGVPGDVLAAQSRVRVLLGDEVAELLEPVVVDPRRVQAIRMDVGRDCGPAGSR